MRNTAIFPLVMSFVLLNLSFAAVGQDNVDPFNRPSENIAKGASYTLDPRPNYNHCTDADDIKQLTDGIYSEGYFWVQKSTVGWRNASPTTITLDLGAAQPIRGVSFHTAAGVAGVKWPLAIFVFVADEEKQFHLAGDLVTLGLKNGRPPAEGYNTHRYWTDALETHGRYVAFVIAAHSYGFVDEIEVYAGDPAWLDKPLTGAPITEVKKYVTELRVASAVKRRLQEDLDTVRENAADRRVPKKVRKSVNETLDEVAQAMAELPTIYGDDFRCVLPLNNLHAKIFAAQANLWAAKGYKPLTLWGSGLWDPLSHVADPDPDTPAEVAVTMMINEYRAGAFNISNATPNEAVVELRITGMPGGTSPDYITVHEVPWTDTHSGKPVAKALPVAPRKGDAYTLSVPSGMTQQVWITFHPVDVAPGTFQGKIELKGAGQSLEAPLTLTIYPIRFPDQPTLHFGGWDYVNSGGSYGVTAQNSDAFVAHLQEHFVDAPWATKAVIPPGAYDAEGNMTQEPSTTTFDEWIGLWPKAQRFCIFTAVGNNFAGKPMDSPAFRKAVTEWLAFWAAYTKKKGIDPEQIFLLVVDEPHELKQDAVILEWARVIHASGTGFNVWEDPTYHDMNKANQDMIAECDVLCPNRPIYLSANQAYRDYYAEQRKKGIALEFYSCSGPSRLLDPYTYYRLQAWTCWQTGAVASYFWAMGDNSGQSSWNEYRLARNGYAPIFLDETTVTGAKEMEACREGIEDYEYFVMLRDAIAKKEKTGAQNAVLDQARALLNESAHRVLEGPGAMDLFWHKPASRTPTDRTLADKVRVEILDKVMELKKKCNDEGY